MAGTLTLKQPEQREAPAPKFNPSAHFGEILGMDGVKFVQGDWLFDALKRPVKKAGEHKLTPLSQEQEIDRVLRQRALAQRTTVIGGGDHPSIPKNVVDAERENARAAGAESLSE